MKSMMVPVLDLAVDVEHVYGGRSLSRKGSKDGQEERGARGEVMTVSDMRGLSVASAPVGGMPILRFLLHFSEAKHERDVLITWHPYLLLYA
jgi:hypothetical protein